MSEFLGEIENGIQQVLRSARRITIQPGPNGYPVSKFDKMAQCGFRIGPDPSDPKVTQMILQPMECWSDPDGTFHAVQWDE